MTIQRPGRDDVRKDSPLRIPAGNGGGETWGHEKSGNKGEPRAAENGYWMVGD